MDNHSEKRVSQRIEVEVPVALDHGMATTRDISWSGIYFLTDQYFAAGKDLNFTLDLTHALPGKPIQLECQATIIRTEEIGDKLGVAAKICDFQYLH